MSFDLDLVRTALVIMDLQKGVTHLQVAPNDTQAVVRNAKKLADAFRSGGGFVVPVRVALTDARDGLHPVTGRPVSASMQARPADGSDFIEELNVSPTDYQVIKCQWGAFFGTDLDLQLRRRGIDIIVLCGIATNIGVETTAREAYQHGYRQIFAVDAMTALSKEEHEHTLRYMFPRIGRLRTTEEILGSLQTGGAERSMEEGRLLRSLEAENTRLKQEIARLRSITRTSDSMSSKLRNALRE